MWIGFMKGGSSGSISDSANGEASGNANPVDHIRLTPDLIALAQGGACVILGAREADGRPVVGIGVGARVDAESRIRVFLDRRPNERLLAAIESGSGVAVTFTRAVDHASFQVKAESAKTARADPNDFPEVGRQCVVARDELNELGLPPQVAAAFGSFNPTSVVVVELTPAAAFMQTPGPGAGSPVRT